jgi:SAM-dependent methyltransferase
MDSMHEQSVLNGASPAERQAALENWYLNPVGQRVWQDEKQLLDHHLPALFGYHLMSLGVSPSLRLADASPIHHQVVLSHAPVADRTTICAKFDALPLDTESIDVALLHHSLDYSADPHQLLRETARVLMPFGYVLIFGFQRWSALGMQHAFSQRFQTEDPVAAHHFMSVTRLHDWLKLLDFDILKSRHTVYVPPQLSDSVQQKLQWFNRLAWGAQLPFGSVYFILARKTVAGVRPIHAPWEKFPLPNPLTALAPRPVAQTTRHRRSRLH